MSSVVISGDVSGSVTLQAPSAAGTTTLTLPATSGTVLTTASGQWITTGSDIYYNTGNVGIGTSSFTGKLNVGGGRSFFGANSETYSIGVGYTQARVNSGQTYYIGATDSATPDLVFSNASGTERMRISTAGGVSIGTTADPGAGAIYATGNITAFYTSDIKLKENIKDVDNALDKVCAIGSKTFDWKDEVIEARGGEDGYFVKKADFGVIAQDVQAVFPQAVRTRDDGTLAVDYEKLATLAFGAIKELASRVAALENK